MIYYTIVHLYIKQREVHCTLYTVYSTISLIRLVTCHYNLLSPPHAIRTRVDVIISVCSPTLSLVSLVLVLTDLFLLLTVSLLLIS